MQFKKAVLLIVFISLLWHCDSQKIEKSAPQILPLPSQIVSEQGEFIIDNSTEITFDKSCKVSATFLKEFIEKDNGIQLKQNNKITYKR